jgi:hypothetical protein
MQNDVSINKLDKNFDFDIKFNGNSNIFDGTINCLFEPEIENNENEEKEREIFEKEFKKVIDKINNKNLNLLYNMLVGKKQNEFASFYSSFMSILCKNLRSVLKKKNYKFKAKKNQQRKLRMDHFYKLHSNVCVKTDDDLFLFFQI